MPAVPSSFIEPLWVQFEALIPPVVDTHPLGCHRRRISDRVVFDKLVAKLVLGGSYLKHGDATCSATTMRARRDEWITAGIFEQVEQITLEAYDQVVGLQLGDVSVDGRHAKAPCGGQCAGPSPVDRRKLGIKWSLLTDGAGIPLGCEIAGGNRHDSPLLRPTLERLGRFGFHLPDQMTVHLDSGYDSNKTRDLLTELGCAGQISPKGMMVAINHTKKMGRGTHQLLARARVHPPGDLHRTPHHRDPRLPRPGERDHHHPPPDPNGLDHSPLGGPPSPTTMTPDGPYPRDLLGRP